MASINPSTWSIARFMNWLPMRSLLLTNIRNGEMHVVQLTFKLGEFLVQHLWRQGGALHHATSLKPRKAQHPLIDAAVTGKLRRSLERLNVFWSTAQCVPVTLFSGLWHDTLLSPYDVTATLTQSISACSRLLTSLDVNRILLARGLADEQGTPIPPKQESSVSADSNPLIRACSTSAAGFFVPSWWLS